MSGGLLHAEILEPAMAGGAWAAGSPLLTPGLQEATMRGSGLWTTTDQGSSSAGAAQPSLLVGNMGACDEPSLVCFIADDSPSVTGGSGSDPLANRYVEAHAALRALARACTCGQCLAAVVHFDLVGGTPAVPVRDRHRGRRRLNPALDEALAMPAKAVGSSVLGPALTEGLRLIGKHPGYRPVLIVASDFQLFDDDPARVISKLDAFAANRGSVHTVVLGRPVPDGVFAPPIQTQLIRPRSVPGSLARAIARGLTERRPGAAIIPDPLPDEHQNAPVSMAGGSAATSARGVIHHGVVDHSTTRVSGLNR
jgi:hypothetical protein